MRCLYPVPDHISTSLLSPPPLLNDWHFASGCPLCQPGQVKLLEAQFGLAHCTSDEKAHIPKLTYRASVLQTCVSCLLLRLPWTSNSSRAGCTSKDRQVFVPLSQSTSSPSDHKALLTHTSTSSSSVKTPLLHLHRKAHHLFPLDPEHFMLLTYLWISISKKTIYIYVYIIFVCVYMCVYMWYSVCSEYRLAELMQSPNIYSFFPMIIVCAKSCWRIRSGVCHKYLHNSVQGR